MTTGTKSVLFGYHQFLLHPLFVAAAWTKLYGFPFDPRLWLAFFVHDLGYWGKPKMDDVDGETHPEFGAKIMRIFGQKWHDLVLYHSRFYSLKAGRKYSKLCVADKLAYMYYPVWFNVFLVTLSGEGKEYVQCGVRRGVPADIRSTISDWRKESLAWLEQDRLGVEFDALSQNIKDTSRDIETLQGIDTTFRDG